MSVAFAEVAIFIGFLLFVLGVLYLMVQDIREEKKA